MPIAVTTCERSAEPEVHALPDDTAMPAMSICMSSGMGFASSIVTCRWPGSRFSRSPFTRTPGMASSFSSSISRSRETRAAVCVMLCTAIEIALPMPTMAGVFSVPARRPRSCAPP